MSLTPYGALLQLRASVHDISHDDTPYLMHTRRHGSEQSYFNLESSQSSRKTQSLGHKSLMQHEVHPTVPDILMALIAEWSNVSHANACFGGHAGHVR